MLPCLSICPWPAYKEAGFHFNSTKFENVTFKLDDILDDSTLKSFGADLTLIDVVETRSIIFGKCFTLKVNKRLSLSQPFFLPLKRSWDMIVFVHYEGEEFWLTWLPYGQSFVNKFRLNIMTDNQLGTISMGLAEKQYVYYPKNAKSCNLSNSGDSKEAILMDAAYHRFLLSQLNFSFHLNIS